MKNLLRLATGILFASFAAASAWAQSGVVTVYSADGLHDGSPNWFQTQFGAFTKATGIKVQYVEAGSGVVVDRVQKEKSNPQADVLVTLPPFMQRAAEQGLLQPYTPAGANEILPRDKDPHGGYYAMVNNYSDFIYDAAALKQPPKTYSDLLKPEFKNKIQYSTPGQAGDGTAVMLEVFHAFGSPQAGLAYLGKLQANNVGPSSSTGRLTALVNKGEIWVANGDVQMNLAQMADNPNIRIFWPAGPNGQKIALPIPYYIALVNGAPHPDNGKKVIDWLLSKEAQASVSDIAQGLPVRKDVHPTGKAYDTIQSSLKGVQIWQPDWSALLKQLPTDVADWHKATGS